MKAIFSVNPVRGQASRWLAWSVGLVAGFGLLLALGWGSNQVLATSHNSIVGSNVGGGACLEAPPGGAGDDGSPVAREDCLKGSGN